MTNVKNIEVQTYGFEALPITHCWIDPATGVGRIVLSGNDWHLDFLGPATSPPNNEPVTNIVLSRK